DSRRGRSLLELVQGQPEIPKRDAKERSTLMPARGVQVAGTSAPPRYCAGGDLGKACSESEAACGTIPIRVMQVTWSLVAGGSEMYAYKIASGLNREGYRSLICALDQGGALEPEIAASGIPYCIMDRRPGIDFSLMWRLFRLFQKSRIHVI